MSDGTKAVDAFLAKVPEPARTALEKLRAQIATAAPDAEELINYGVPMFRLGGRNLPFYHRRSSLPGAKQSLSL